MLEHCEDQTSRIPAYLKYFDFETDINEFRTRWKRARLSILSKFIDRNIDNHEESIEYQTLLQCLVQPEEKQQQILKGVFDNSRILGLSMANYYRHEWNASEIGKLLQTSNLHCMNGKWSQGDNGNSWILNRDGCFQGKDAFICDYWRESINGLIMGLGMNVSHSRHKSVGNGDTSCKDVFYQSSLKQHRFGTVPDEIKNAVTPLISNLKTSGISLKLYGFSECNLYYLIETKETKMCGPGGEILTDTILRKIKLILPNIKLVDMTPRAVISGDVGT